MARAVGQRGRRTDHGVAAGAQRREPRRQLARESLHAADLASDGGAAVDQYRRRCWIRRTSLPSVAGDPDAARHGRGRSPSRRRTPAISMRAPISASIQASKPVRGSELPLALELVLGSPEPVPFGAELEAS